MLHCFLEEHDAQYQKYYVGREAVFHDFYYWSRFIMIKHQQEKNRGKGEQSAGLQGGDER